MSADRGGVFGALSRLVKLGFGGRAGSGSQYVSWIHERDFVRAIDFLIENAGIDGVVNVASPNRLPNSEFMAHLREAWNMRLGLPATEWMLEIGALFSTNRNRADFEEQTSGARPASAAAVSI